MSSQEDLLSLQHQISSVDQEMVQLFLKRMQISEDIAHVKASANLSIVNEEREQKVLKDALAWGKAENKGEILAFMRTLIALSKQKQSEKLLLPDSVTFPAPTKVSPGNIRTAYQGPAGAWSEHGAQQLFPQAILNNYEFFEDVFKAVSENQADYGVVPIENSQTGAIGEVYDLLRRYGCYIVGQVWITVAQCLLTTENASLDHIREVYSHAEGLAQCRRFLRNKHWELTPCRNTAYAVELVAQKNHPRYAAIGSRRAAQLHGLKVLVPDIMDNLNNQTRFIAIAAQPQYDETCDTVSITFSTAHKSGALCAVLQSFMLANINLTRIESRPVSANKYRFFADLESNILSDITLDALKQAAMHCEYFEVLGCYKTCREQALPTRN